MNYVEISHNINIYFILPTKQIQSIITKKLNIELLKKEFSSAEIKNKKSNFWMRFWKNQFKH